MLKTKPKTKVEKALFASQLTAFKKQKEKEEAIQSAPLIPFVEGLPIAVVIDIDGTLANRSDRGIFDFDKSINDEPSLRTKYILQLIDDANEWRNDIVGRTHIILLTGREQQFADVTNQWLARHNIPFDTLFMRRTSDRRPSNVVKEEIWAGNIRGKYNVLFVIDDRQQDINMYRQVGLYCFAADNTREHLLDKPQNNTIS